MKIAPIMAAVDAWNARRGATPPVSFSQLLVHTGQHYDESMSSVFFRDLELSKPSYSLEVGSGSHAQQTAAVLDRLEPILLDQRPDLVVVVGDVNSTVAATLCAAKLGMPVAHVEAGLRSGDRSMPEELNRLVTDQLADLLFTTERDADENLTREGIARERIRFVGNTMIDSLDGMLARMPADFPEGLGLRQGNYVLATLHRPSNVDEPAQLSRIVKVIAALAERLPVVFPVHARTRQRLQAAGLLESLSVTEGVILTEPLGYPRFLALMNAARLVVTDSGGVQEETTALSVACLTLRTSTERPITITEGTNRLVDPYDLPAIIAAADAALADGVPAVGRRPDLWDGHASERIVAAIADWSLTSP
jgi:UDP-N-acetylglucosamine 2-epimerase (non-hydrolysing)